MAAVALRKILCAAMPVWSANYGRKYTGSKWNREKRNIPNCSVAFVHLFCDGIVRLLRGALEPETQSFQALVRVWTIVAFNRGRPPWVSRNRDLDLPPPQAA